jgi:hypothetical protein
MYFWSKTFGQGNKNLNTCPMFYHSGNLFRNGCPTGDVCIFLGEDHWEPCAAEVQKAAIEHSFLSIGNHKVCSNGIADFAEYFEAKAKQDGCKAKILDNFLSILSDVGIDVFKDIRKLMGFECEI